jgi:hypothetical protein
MKKLMIVIVILALLTACVSAPTQDIQATIAIGMQQTRAAEPTATFTPEPTPDIQATIEAGIAATQAAQPSPTLSPTLTATNVPTATDVPLPTATNTPEIEASYNVFIDKYKVNFEGQKSKMSTPVTSSIQRVEFEEDEQGRIILWIETIGDASDISPTLLGFSIGVFSGLMSSKPGDSDYEVITLPPDLEFVRFVFWEEGLVEGGHFYTTWAEMSDYFSKKIEFIDMFDNADWDLP